MRFIADACLNTLVQEMPRESTTFLRRDEATHMVDSISQDTLLQAFRTIGVAGDTIHQRCVIAVHEALRTLADDMRRAGRPIERLVACVKSTATVAGIRESHDRIVADAVLSAIAYYFGDENVGLIPSPDGYRSRRPQSIEQSIPPGLDLFSVARVVAGQRAREPRA